MGRYAICRSHLRIFLSTSSSNGSLIVCFEREKMILKQGEMLRHIQKEFMIIFVEMTEIYKRHTT